MEINKYDVSVKNLQELMNNFEKLPIELKAVTLESITRISSQLREYKLKAEALLVAEMEAQGATKAPFIDYTGNERMATLRAGSVSCTEKEIDTLYEKSGFQPIEIGEYVFKPSWSKAKEARKFGGAKKDLIDKYFKPGKSYIKID